MIHNDHLGTPQKMTDGTGAIVWSADYKPFGEAMITVSTITNNLRFPGQYFDAETGLNYNYNRDYNPTIGKYTTPDKVNLATLQLPLPLFPEESLNSSALDEDTLKVALLREYSSKISEGSLNALLLKYFLYHPHETLNPYAYAANNPNVYIDPHGESIQIIGALIGLAVIVAVMEPIYIITMLNPPPPQNTFPQCTSCHGPGNFNIPRVGSGPKGGVPVYNAPPPPLPVPVCR